MQPKVEVVINGFLKLSENERSEFIDQLEEYNKYPYTTGDKLQKSLNESRTFGVNFGPAPSGCPCCGK
jgi:hypothetical protein